MTDKESTAQRINDFIQGQSDCKKGIPHKSKSEEYDRGYSAQYTLDEVRAEQAR